MVAASKLFEWPLNHVHCSQLPLHHGKTCFKSFLSDIYRCTISGLGYFSPLILTPLALKGTNISIENFTETLQFYVETILSSSTAGSLVFASICLLRNLKGEFKPWFLLLGPYLGTQVCWFFPKRCLRIFFMATTQTVLEALLRQHKCSLTYFVLNSKALQTLIFMISSTIIMHYKRLGLYNGFWFIKPEIEQEEKNANAGNSKEMKKTEQTWKCLLKGCKTYFIYGLSLDILNMILKQTSSFKNKELSQVILASIKGLRFNMTCFFMSYAGLYKLVLHYLPKYMPGLLSTDIQHAIAAFLGGASYIFVNKLTYNTFAAILAVQISWQDYCRKIDKTKEKYYFLEVLKEIPFNQIIFPINIAYIVYSFFYRNDSLNSLGKNLARALSNQKIQQVFDYAIKNELDFLLRDCSSRTLYGAF